LADDGLNIARPVPHDEECDLASDPLVAKPSPNRRLLSRIPCNIFNLRDRHGASLYHGHDRRKQPGLFMTVRDEIAQTPGETGAWSHEGGRRTCSSTLTD